jgi:hypothetical protein
LQVYDEKLERNREVPLEAVKQVDCIVKREWMEKEWKFRETTSDEKMFTGRTYPSREYTHRITLRDGRTIAGPLSAIIYVQPAAASADAKDAAAPAKTPETRQFILHKRDKGEPGTDLQSLVYVRCIKLGKEALGRAEK